MKRVLIAVDCSNAAECAARTGMALAEALDGCIALVHVLDMGSASVGEFDGMNRHVLEKLRRKGDGLLRRVLAEVGSKRCVATMLLEGEPAAMIMNTAHEWNADVIVLGSDSRGRLAQFLLGSTADAVIRRAPCPVVTVRPQLHAQPQADVNSPGESAPPAGSIPPRKPR